MFKSVNYGKLPTKGSKYSAAVDVYANEYVIIGAGETVKVPLGIAICDKEIDKIISHNFVVLERNKDKDFSSVRNNFLKSHYISLKPRSSLRMEGLISHSGVVDLDYKDEIKMIIHNPITKFAGFDNTYRGASDNLAYRINKGDKIGQLIILPHCTYFSGIESEEERTGGFGSTGE